MLTRTQKEQRWKQFMETYFGMHNWITIFLLKINITYQVRTINFLLKSIKSTTEDAILEVLSEIELLRMKHYLFLDAIMKVQICVESLLVLLDVLAEDYDKVAETMTFYSQNRPHEVVRKIRD